MSSSPSSSTSLSALAVFRNTLNPERIRSVHVYRGEDGDEEEQWRPMEREFTFSPDSCIEIRARPLILLDRPLAKFLEGENVGLWLCVLAFDSAHLSSSPSAPPPFLCFSRNPLLMSVPSLAIDLQQVYLLTSRADNEHKPLHFVSEETQPEKENESISSEELGLSLKKRRAATDHVARISLSDLAKYFNLPIAEASRNLNIGLTVLKRKCREFGIPRWPHRKIKSLDTLIHNLQEEVSRLQKDNEASAIKAATRRQQMLESEKEGIERSPFMELQKETKRFRQDVFKRRHEARARSRMSQGPVPSRSSL